MNQEYVYEHGPFSVKLTEALNGELHEWVNTECTCEEHEKRVANPRFTGSEERCGHIREAILYHHYQAKISPVVQPD